MRKLNVGCGTHYARGWLNVDAMVAPNTHPDVRCLALPFPAGTFDAVYLGHVLEHVQWEHVPSFLADVHRVMRSGAQLLATGPDVYRTIHEWRRERVGWELVQSVMEHAHEESAHWREAVHHWNCHEERMLFVLETAGFKDMRATVDVRDFTGWPVVNWSAWQCAAFAFTP